MTDQAPTPQEPQDEEENEVLRAARELQAQKEAADATEAADREAGKGKRAGWKTAAAAGLGSAAVIAALLYANRDKIK
ncbi:hypothetical protein CVO77_05895 [Sphingopyxis lindanitolerans]|uniref:Uncharacterized protein n=1 Tax=Sphingopyxis lindanitolerans TaxID=2054227 RepID=A0A2S8B6T9_9SPHN|nr:hypothetical protein [Sphingopyxis lindanitolerans]PQM28050.1 hypothetical protein CVO77_05895 [Sphingopyxis lindanitolerans]